MTCVTSLNFAVIINEIPTNFFKDSTGLKHGCTLSLLLVLLVIESLSRRILEACSRGNILGCKLSQNVTLSHIMFIDDVLVVGVAKLSEWRVFYQIISRFGEASGLLLSKGKSTLISMKHEDELMLEIVKIFAVKSINMDDGFHYLGFFLKPNSYEVKTRYGLPRNLRRSLISQVVVEGWETNLD